MRDVPDGWRVATWGDLATLEYGKALRDYRAGIGGTPVFGTNGRVGTTDRDPLFGRPGVIVGRKGAYRGIHYSDQPFYVIDTAFYLSPVVDLDLRWSYYELLTHDINGMDSGSAIPSTSRPSFYAMPVLVPPVGEQRAIADVLGALDDKIESNRRRATCAEELLDVLALTVPSTDQVGVGLLAEVDRLSVDPSGSSVVDHFSLPAFDGSRLPERVAGTSIRSSKLAVQGPSVLVSRLNPESNRTWYAVPDPAVPAMASTEWLVLRPVKGLSLGGLWLAVRDVHFRGELARRATGTSGSHQRIRPADALSIEVPDPRGGDAAVLEEADALLDLVHQARVESETLATLRDTLLPELLSGRLRVPEAEGLVADAI